MRYYPRGLQSCLRPSLTVTILVICESLENKLSVREPEIAYKHKCLTGYQIIVPLNNVFHAEFHHFHYVKAQERVMSGENLSFFGLMGLDLLE
jgi:hypothetical protein